MRTSVERMLTTHVGSLPRPVDVTTGVFAIEAGDDVDEAEHHRNVERAVADVVRSQVEIGIDVVSDGEMSKISYATYVKSRLTGFAGDSPRRTPRDLEDFGGLGARFATVGKTATYARPVCVGEITLKDRGPLDRDLAAMRSAVDRSGPTEGFLNSASPGVIALFQPDEHYGDHERYLAALSEAMRYEYEAIVDAGFILQLDSPDLGLGRHMMFKDKTDAEYLRLAHLHVEALNDAVRNIEPDRMRLHLCWGNYEGPHTHDIELREVLPVVLRAKPQALVFESSNPRHAHEWEVFADADIPESKILIPGVIDSTTHFVEHPRLVAQRIERFAKIVGKERVIAGTDCGFSTFAGYAGIDPDVVTAKLETLVAGAALASDALW